MSGPPGSPTPMTSMPAPIPSDPPEPIAVPVSVPVTTTTTASAIQLATQVPPARTSPGMALAIGGGYTASFAQTMQYLGPWNWPLPAPTDPQAMALAGFIITSAATLFHLWANRKAKNTFDDAVNSSLDPTMADKQ